MPGEDPEFIKERRLHSAQTRHLDKPALRPGGADVGRVEGCMRDDHHKARARNQLYLLFTACGLIARKEPNRPPGLSVG